ncbi:amidohydrolase family protein [Aquimarina pacifica]|uniref:amidohydrolase family protein n=1 Tax=Aquimarina pacifica TaxID=1296415 RepID=UPI0004B319DC|nr:amidohydrolase family protein [Aquimarina pacifica]
MELDWTINKIDAHVHFNTLRTSLIEYGVQNNIRFLSINTDIPFFPSIDNQEKTILSLKKEHPDHIDYVTTFSCHKWGSEQWLQESLDRIKKSVDQGAVGVKVWKNIGMSLKDDNGHYIKIDHPSFAPIFSYLEENKLLLIGHIGEPKNCWLPLEEMTVEQDRKYFAAHPEYHMFLHPEYPDYQEHIDARDKVLARHPNLNFVGLHLSSQEWETDLVATFLDTFPNAMVDLAERICHLQHQAVTNWQKVYDFFIRYQDRIIYGSDVIDDNSLSDEQLIAYMDERYKKHWQFFTRQEMMSAPKVSENFRGLGLPFEVIKKIYSENALRTYKLP